MGVTEFLGGKKINSNSHWQGTLIVTTVSYMDWYDENVLNPRIWKDWSCEEMMRFALEFKDEEFADVQQSKFHNDLSSCL